MASPAPSAVAAMSASLATVGNPLRSGRQRAASPPAARTATAKRHRGEGRIANPLLRATAATRAWPVDTARRRRRVVAGASGDDETRASKEEDEKTRPGSSSSSSSNPSSAPSSANSSSFADEIAAMTGDVPPDPTLALEKQRAEDEADAAERANAVDERVELPPDTIAPMPEWMYPRRLDSIPALFGRLNPLTGVLVYYTGAVLRECAGQPAVALQWMLFVFFPSCAALSFARKFWYELAYNREKKRARERGEPPPPPRMEFNREQRAAWLDLHLGYAILAPAGATGGEGASWWLLLAPFFMLARFSCAKIGFLTQPRRWFAVVGGAAALAALLMSASGTLTQALGGLRGGGYVGYVLAPVTFALVYAFYLAPAALLPGAIARAWRGEGYSKPRRRVNPNPNPEATAEEARARKAWTVIGVVAMGISLTTGSDVPVFLCFFAQLFKADPSKLLQVMIDKGEPARAEMDQAIADKAAGLFKRKEGEPNGEERDGGKEGDEKEGTDGPSSPAPA